METLHRRPSRADKAYQREALTVHQWDSEGEAVLAAFDGLILMILKTKTLCAFFCAALLAAAPVDAQVTAPREAAHIEFGTLAVYPTLQVLDAGIDSNVFNETTDPTSDYTLTVASKVLSVLRLGSNELLLQAGNDYLWFHETTSERSSNMNYAMRFNVSASRFRPFFGTEYIKTRLRRTPEIDARARRVDRAMLAGMAFDLSPRTALTASARAEDVTYDDGEEFRNVELAEALNRLGRIADAGVRYAVTPLTTLSVTAGYEEQHFTDSTFRNLKRYTVGPTFEFAPEAAIRGRVATALELFKPDDAELQEQLGLTYLATVNWSLYGRTTFDLASGRNITYSYLDTDPYYLLTNVKLTITQPLAGYFELYAGYSQEHMAYRWHLPADASVAEPDRVDVLKVASGGVGVRLGRNVHVRIGVDRTRRRSVEEALQNFDRTRIMSAVTVGS